MQFDALRRQQSIDRREVQVSKSDKGACRGQVIQRKVNGCIKRPGWQGGSMQRQARNAYQSCNGYLCVCGDEFVPPRFSALHCALDLREVEARAQGEESVDFVDAAHGVAPLQPIVRNVSGKVPIVSRIERTG